MRKAVLYVDGFNFYYGVRNHFKAGEPQRGYSLSGLVWCDFRALIERHFHEPDTGSTFLSSWKQNQTWFLV